MSRLEIALVNCGASNGNNFICPNTKTRCSQVLNRPYCLLIIYYDPEWQPTQIGDSGSPLFKVTPMPRTPYVLITIGGIFTTLRPADNPQFMEFRAVECVNKFYGVAHRYGE